MVHQHIQEPTGPPEDYDDVAEGANDDNAAEGADYDDVAEGARNRSAA